MVEVIKSVYANDGALYIAITVGTDGRYHLTPFDAEVGLALGFTNIMAAGATLADAEAKAKAMLNGTGGTISVPLF